MLIKPHRMAYRFVQPDADHIETNRWQTHALDQAHSSAVPFFRSTNSHGTYCTNRYDLLEFNLCVEKIRECLLENT